MVAEGRKKKDERKDREFKRGATGPTSREIRQLNGVQKKILKKNPAKM